METISIVLADDHEVVRSGLRMLLEESPETAVVVLTMHESHRARIQQKTGSSTRATMVRYALDQGLIE